MNGVCCWSNLEKKKNHIIICYIFCCCQVLPYLEYYKRVWTSYEEQLDQLKTLVFVQSPSLFKNILFNKLVLNCYVFFIWCP